MAFFKSFSKRDVSILISNLLDHFDTPLYGMVAPIIAPLFFPDHDPVVQLILAYSIFGTSLITRPLGAVLFGMWAHRQGPRVALFGSLMGVGVFTFLMGCLPTHAMLSYGAPLCLVLVRALKGICAAGESTIAKLYILEDKERPHAFFTSYVYQSSTVAGILLSSLAITALTCLDNPLDYWRVPFWCGGVVAVLGLYFRKVSSFRSSIKREIPSTFASLWVAIWKQRVGVLHVTIATSFSYLTYSLPFIVFNSFIPLITPISLSDMMVLNSILMGFDMVAIFVIGHYVRSFNTNKIMGVASGLLALTAIPLFYGLLDASFLYVSLVRLWIVLLGLLYSCPIYIWYLDQFKGPDKYFLVGVGNAIGTATVGRLTPVFCLWLWHTTHEAWMLGAYTALLSFLAAVMAVWLLRKRLSIRERPSIHDQ